MPWKIAKKDLKVLKRKKSILFYTFGMPLLLAAAFSLVVQNDIVSAGANALFGLASLTWIFVVLAAVLPTSIAAYSIVGEKTEKSLEPLLATPTTDDEILLGKALAAFVPCVSGLWIGAGAFLAVTDYLMLGVLGYYYFPGWIPGITLFLVAPLASMLGIQVGVILSSRVSDVRGANQLGGLMWIPFMVIFIASIEGIVVFDATSLFAIAVVLLAINIGFFYLSRSTFNREEILTKWK
jgi:ABC-2 type transport system permease protein